MSPGGESDFDPLPVALAELVGHDGAITDEECCESAPGSQGSEFEGDAEEPCDGEEDDPVNKAFTPQDEACHAGALEGFGEDEAEGVEDLHGADDDQDAAPEVDELTGICFCAPRVLSAARVREDWLSRSPSMAGYSQSERRCANR